MGNAPPTLAGRRPRDFPGAEQPRADVLVLDRDSERILDLDDQLEQVDRVEIEPALDRRDLGGASPSPRGRLRAQLSDPGHRRLLREIDCAEPSRRVAAGQDSPSTAALVGGTPAPRAPAQSTSRPSGKGRQARPPAGASPGSSDGAERTHRDDRVSRRGTCVGPPDPPGAPRRARPGGPRPGRAPGHGRPAPAPSWRSARPAGWSCPPGGSR